MSILHISQSGENVYCQLLADPDHNDWIAPPTRLRTDIESVDRLVTAAAKHLLLKHSKVTDRMRSVMQAFLLLLGACYLREVRGKQLSHDELGSLAGEVLLEAARRNDHVTAWEFNAVVSALLATRDGLDSQRSYSDGGKLTGEEIVLMNHFGWARLNFELMGIIRHFEGLMVSFGVVSRSFPVIAAEVDERV